MLASLLEMDKLLCINGLYDYDNYWGYNIRYKKQIHSGTQKPGHLFFKKKN